MLRTERKITAGSFPAAALEGSLGDTMSNRWWSAVDMVG